MILWIVISNDTVNVGKWNPAQPSDVNENSWAKTGIQKKRPKSQSRRERQSAAPSSSPSRSGYLKINLQGHHMLPHSSASLFPLKTINCCSVHAFLSFVFSSFLLPPHAKRSLQVTVPVAIRRWEDAHRSEVFVYRWKCTKLQSLWIFERGLQGWKSVKGAESKVLPSSSVTEQIILQTFF